MKKTLLSLIMFFLIVFLGNSASAFTIDVTDGIAWSGANGLPTYTYNYSDLGVTVSSFEFVDPNYVPGGTLTWNTGDGIGINNEYEYDEIELSERLIVTFSEPVYLSSIHLTDLFNEHGYLEEGGYRLKTGPRSWDATPTGFIADSSQFLNTTNGDKTINFSNPLVYGIGFGSIERACQNHEFSLASIEVNPVPEPATIVLLGSGLVGLAGFGRKRFKK